MESSMTSKVLLCISFGFYARRQTFFVLISIKFICNEFGAICFKNKNNKK